MRGLTLLETLLAVSLLSLLAIAVAGWTGVVARAESTARPRLERTMSMAAALRCIEDDLNCGDLASGRPERRGTKAPRVQVDGQGHLLIETRDGGPAVHAYAFDHQRGALDVVRAGARRPLVVGLEAWSATFDAKSGVLEIAWSGGGRPGTRRRVVQ